MRNDGGGLDVGGTSGDKTLNEKGKNIVIFYALKNDYITINILVWHADCGDNNDSSTDIVFHMLKNHFYNFFF